MMKNSKEQIDFAAELFEFSGINLQDRGNIEQSIQQHRNAEIQRGQERVLLRAKTQAALEVYFAHGGRINHFPPGKVMGYFPVIRTKNF